MNGYPSVIQNLIDRFRRLPGVGPKSAERYALYLLRQPHEEVTALIEQLAVVRDRIGRCEDCGMLRDGTRCGICGDARRDRTVLCVVAEMPDLLAIERTGEFHGLYHILDGLLAPIEGVGPEQLRIRELVERVREGSKNKNFSPSRREGEREGEGQQPSVSEIIFAFDPTIEGETTMNYLAQQLGDSDIRLTRIARGLPVGGDLEYADPVTLSDALSGRRTITAPAAVHSR
ncbi:recombination protein RecR [Candidatus Uhrbacteria bacterium]|nr:recombination protein RecR [Candidatus Uhrbacteria bacterium]